jgi:hypothetical protein
MLPLPPAVVKCHQCEKCYWLDDAKEIGTLNEWGGDEDAQSIDPSWLTAPLLEEPDEMSYYAAIASGLATTPEHERNLRLLAWWKSNDLWRHSASASRPHLTQASRQNLNALVRLFNQADENDQCIKAKALRELGEFDLASSLLSQITSEPYANVISQLRAFCDAKDASVRELRLES